MVLSMPKGAWSSDQLSKLLQESVEPGFEQKNQQMDLNMLIKLG